MTRWEYQIIDSQDAPGGGWFKGKGREDVETYLNGLGDQGWEIIALNFREMEQRLSFSGVARRVKEGEASAPAADKAADKED